MRSDCKKKRASGLLLSLRAMSVGVLLPSYAALAAPQQTPAPANAQTKAVGVCRQAVFEGVVVAGQSFQKVFTKGLMFGLEPLPSGWIVRVLPTDEPRGAHDDAELATPPYQSVSPLLISTDWSFRAQDAVAWNPRRFQYAASKTTFHALEALEPKVLAGDGASEVKLAMLLAGQPQGTLRILDSRLAPGIADQARMAAAVASHLATTPHSADSSAAPSPLGKLEEIRFRVELELPAGQRAATGVHEEACKDQPTGRVAPASQQTRTRTGR